MKRKFILEIYGEYKRVTYYSLRLDTLPYCEAELFFDKFEYDTVVEESLVNLVAWIEEIGHIYGALPKLFRLEDNAHALPPPRKYLSKIEKNGLRLYCLRLNDKAVILLNGDVKTARKVKDCPKCKPHFRFANKVARLVDKKVLSGEIKFTSTYEIDLSEQIEFEL